jgi:uncharacterized SAM-binding protein YcdF (DUF218 family)
MTTNNPESLHSLAKSLFNFLYLRDELSIADAIVGFGHFDEKIPFHCGKLYSQGYGKFIIFTGGVGAGSTGLNKPEAQVFSDKLCQHFPEIQREKVVLEDQSTNTSENIQFTLSLLEQKYSAFLAPNGLRKLVLVANAYRQRRVWLTCKKILKNIELINNPPNTDFEMEMAMFSSLGENLYVHMINEMERIKTYPAKGFIEYSRIPDDILCISEQIRNLI